MPSSHVKRFAALAVLVWQTSLVCQAADWPQWGGADARSMVSSEKNLPESFSRGDRISGGGVDASHAENLKWAVKTGSATYGNPTISQGRVFLGSDDFLLESDDRIPRTRGGLVQCLDEQTGQCLWRLVVPKRKRMPPKIHFGFQHLGVLSSVAIDGDRAYVLTNAADVVCLDIKGLADGNDGPFTEEAAYIAGEGETPIDLSETDADIIWRFDLMDELGVYIHDAASCSPLVYGDCVYLSTSNGVDEPHTTVLAPEAPAFIALDKHTGRLVGRERDGLSSRLYHCQWNSPSLGIVNGKPLLFLGGGDGLCYAFEPLADVGEDVATLNKVWWYDCNPNEYKYEDGKLIPYYRGDKRKSYSTNKNDGKYVGPSQIISTPVFSDNRVYVAIGQDPAHGRGRGLLHCIDATKTGDLTETGRIWAYDGIERTIATPAVADGLVYIPDLGGKFHCLDAKTGECYWVYNLNGETWGGSLVADGKLYIGNKRMFFVMAAGKEAKVLGEVRLGNPIYSTPVAANGTVFIASQHYLWAAAKK